MQEKYRRQRANLDLCLFARVARELQRFGFARRHDDGLATLVSCEAPWRAALLGCETLVHTPLSPT